LASELIDGAMQQAAQPGRQFIGTLSIHDYDYRCSWYD
jgi:hypothetical protein